MGKFGVMPLKITSFLSPIVSHLVSDLLKEALPFLCCQLIVFAHLAQFQPATRTRFKLPKAVFQIPTQPREAALSATVTNGKYFKINVGPPKSKYRKQYVWKHLRYWAFQPCPGMANGPQLTVLLFSDLK